MLPMIDMLVKGREVRALVDTGCTMTVVSTKVCGQYSGMSSLVAFDGSVVQCKGEAKVPMVVNGVSMVMVVHGCGRNFFVRGGCGARAGCDSPTRGCDDWSCRCYIWRPNLWGCCG